MIAADESFLIRTVTQPGSENKTETIVATQIVATKPVRITQSPNQKGDGVLNIACTSDLDVHANTVEISGPLVLPGRKVRIVARHLIFTSKDEAIIDVTPRAKETGNRLPAADVSPAKAGLGLLDIDLDRVGADGVQGLTGAAGDHGDDSDSISIVAESVTVASGTLKLLADGGPGGPGQKGGKGQDGGEGERRKMQMTSQIGPRGGNGGPGGVGGVGGKGGKAGPIMFLYRQYQEGPSQASSQPRPWLKVSTLPGPDGAPGKGGDGGGAGLGGINRKGNGRGQSGGPGPAGAEGGFPQFDRAMLFEPQFLQTICLAQKPDAFAPFVRLEFISQLLGYAERLYISSDFAAASDLLLEAREIYEWICDVLRPYSGPATEIGAAGDYWAGSFPLDRGNDKAYDLAAVDVGGRVAARDPFEKQQLSAIYYRALAALTNMAQLRDYFGYSRTYVPRASRRIFESIVPALLDHLTAIEPLYQRYFEKQEATALQKADTQTLISLSQENLQLLASETEEVRKQLSSTLDDIRASERIVADAKSWLLAVMDDFKKQVEASFSLDLAQIFGILEQLAFTPTGASGIEQILRASMLTAQTGRALDAFRSAFDEISDAQGIKRSKRYIVRAISHLEKTITTLKDGSQFLGGSVSVDEDAMSLVFTSENQLSTLLDQCADFSGADEVRKRLDTYANAIITRNQHVLEFNGRASQFVALIKRTESQTEQQNDLKSSLERADAETIELFSELGFLARLYSDTKFLTIKYINLLSRCYRAAYLCDAPSNLPRSFAGLSGRISTQLLRQELLKLSAALPRELERASTEPATWPRNGSDGRSTYRYFYRFEEPAALSALRAAGKAQFKIPLVTRVTQEGRSPLAGKANVKVTHIRAWIKGITTKSGHVAARLTHLGPEQSQSIENTTFEFVHAPVTIEFKYDATHADTAAWAATAPTPDLPADAIKNVTPLVPSEDSILDGDTSLWRPDSDLTPISPFAVWDIEIVREHAEGVDLSGLTALWIELAGTSLPFKERS
ncbi:hypothetical protein [Rhizobium sp. Root1220]|uniref:hypothetical protein n=1 Tax=Rhizobium sp. Root1220 TaxID=1736432 RepID=UPI0006FC5159|nr:hypothetical protein [Rhizobium sp. Root1220]KQV78105.1 hypothetical protein ASC90_27330 [Rhizobium sp. Root1220]